MMEVFRSRTRMGAWAQATEFLLGQRGRHALNIALDIENPSVATKADRQLSSELDDAYAALGQHSLHTVADTIFPGWEYRRHGLKGVFEYYPEEYALMKSGDSASWGTYAFRLVCRTKADGSTFNPLGHLIDKMKVERSGEFGSTYRARYEIGLSDPAYDLAVYDNAVDETRRRRMPCLSHLSFKLLDDRVHLSAIYRYHDYRFKTPGNLLGLARLQNCVANEVGAKMGNLTVLSTYAMIEPQARMGEFRDLVAAFKGE